LFFLLRDKVDGEVAHSAVFGEHLDEECRERDIVVSAKKMHHEHIHGSGTIGSFPAKQVVWHPGVLVQVTD
jgi:hypothetical protein